MHKTLLLLGLLRSRSMYGYEIHRIIRAHGELYSDLKKANLYYLLERLALEGYLLVEAEGGTRGARGERLIYQITDKGRQRFTDLLREIIVTYTPVHTGISTAVMFLSQLAPDEGLTLLTQRRDVVEERRAQLVSNLGKADEGSPLLRIASDHLLSLVDAELAWIERSITYLDEIGWTVENREHTS